ncbi:MAG TPA: hypothetical protein VGP77_16040 [Vicinamibacterales bacterium]|jgi:hypothetical protein|nr:hypothetical protein [Vicinamibacterales bacterium]
MSRGTTLTLQTETEFFIESCFACGCQFAMTTDFKDNRMRLKDTFYCPAGHAQHYTGKSDKELRREAEARERAALDQLQAAEAENRRIKREAAAERKAAAAEQTRLAQRARGGACPCCGRSFVQLARHMASKHPEHGAPT